MDNFSFTKRVLFLGVPDMAFVGLDTLLYSGVNIVGVIGPRKTHNTYYNFKNFVASRKLNFIEYNTISDVELIELIKGLNIDIAVVCSFNDKIPKEFLETIKDGVINVHPSLLPEYRGGNPYSRVIINGEKQTGVTLHFMSEEFDKGDIIAQETYDIEPDETMGTLFNKTNALGATMLVKALVHYEKTGTLPRQPQPIGEFIKAPNITDSEMVIDFNKTAVEIDRLTRGLNPYFSAMTLFKNQAVKIHKVSIAQLDNIDNFQNGEICKIENGKVYIKTGDGCIIPEIMQYAGFFTGDCADFIRVANPKIGDKFTNGYN